MKEKSYKVILEFEGNLAKLIDKLSWFVHESDESSFRWMIGNFSKIVQIEDKDDAINERKI